MPRGSPDPPVPPQVVPRPASAVPGRPAPWAGLPPAARRGLSLQVVDDALARVGQLGPVPPPGEDILWVEVPGAAAPGEPAVASAVLVALFEESGESRVVLTRR